MAGKKLSPRAAYIRLCRYNRTQCLKAIAKAKAEGARVHVAGLAKKYGVTAQCVYGWIREEKLKIASEAEA